MQRASFPADVRLRRASEFHTVFRTGVHHVRTGVVVIVAPGGTAHARLGLAVAKRHLPRAVDRNHVKRIVRESFRLTRHRLGAADIVVLARKQTAGLSRRDLSAQLHDIWRRVIAAAD